MGAALASEWVKFRSLLSNTVLLLIAVAVGLGLSVLVAVAVPVDEVGDTDTFGLATAGMAIAQYLLGVLGILAITQEYRFGLSKVTFAAEPRRARVVLAKLVVVALVVAVTAAVIVALELVVAGGILQARDIGFDLAADGVARAAAGWVVVAMLTAAAGLGLGAVLRNPAAAIPILVLWPLVIEPLLTLLDPLERWLPFRAGSELATVGRLEVGLGPWAGGAYFTAFVAVLLALGTWLVHRRDA